MLKITIAMVNKKYCESYQLNVGKDYPLSTTIIDSEALKSRYVFQIVSNWHDIEKYEHI